MQIAGGRVEYIPISLQKVTRKGGMGKNCKEWDGGRISSFKIRLMEMTRLNTLPVQLISGVWVWIDFDPGPSRQIFGRRRPRLTVADLNNSV